MPEWMTELAREAERMTVPPHLRPPAAGGRGAAVLILFGADVAGPDVLIVQRSDSLRSHAGQPAFPGGGIDPEDSGPVAAALREAAEEAGVNPAGVRVMTVLPDMYVSRSGYRVSPVLAWWREPNPVAPGDPAEVTAVARVAVADLADPARRMMIMYPSGTAGPVFIVESMLIWGFTAYLLDRLLALGGWELPWDAERVTELPPGMVLSDAERPDRAGS